MLKSHKNKKVEELFKIWTEKETCKRQCFIEFLKGRMRIVRREDECAYIIREGYSETTGMTRMLEVRKNVI